MVHAKIKMLPEEYILRVRKSFMRYVKIFIPVGLFTAVFFYACSSASPAGRMPIAGLLILCLLLLLPSIRMYYSAVTFEKNNQSDVVFEDEEIRFEHNGRCWRSIRYDSITGVRVQTVEKRLFFEGKRGAAARSDRYIFLAGVEPNTVLAIKRHMFTAQPYFMYSEDILNLLVQKLPADVPVEVLPDTQAN